MRNHRRLVTPDSESRTAQRGRHSSLRNPQSPIRSRRPAFTLAEAVISLSILTILMVAMGGAVVVSARALPQPNSPVNTELSLASAIDRLCAELRYAKTIESSSPTSIQFTVSDRDGDGADEHIRYQWLGSGNALTRTYNSGAAVSISPTLTNFALTYQNKKITTTSNVTTTVDSGELLFTSFNGWSGVIVTQMNSLLNSTNWATSYFKPDALTFPSNVSSVSITRVRVKLKRVSSPDGASITMGIYTPTTVGGPVPSTTQVGSSSTITSASLATSYPSGFIDFPFTDVTFASPPTELNWVAKGTGTNCGALMYYYALLAVSNNPVFLYTSNSGSAWNPSSNRIQNDAVFEVYGSYKYPTTVVVSTDTYYLHTFTVAADSASPAAHHETTMRALNQPTIAGP